jgi:hypothetical protein
MKVGQMIRIYTLRADNPQPCAICKEILTCVGYSEILWGKPYVWLCEGCKDRYIVLLQMAE